jgi:carboxypeptidase Q
MEEPAMKGMPTLIRREAGDVTVKPEQAKVSAYFNVNNGTGKIRGVFMQDNAAVEPIFKAWMEPFKDLGMTTLTMRNTGGTDHLSFDAVGIPGFQFIQDPIEYETRTHHSNMDVYDRLQPDDLKQAAVIVASFVYDAAMRDQMLPRKPIEKGIPKQPDKEEQS